MSSYADRLHSLFQQSSRLLMNIAIVLGLVWLGWSGWQSWEQWRELPLPAERVTAKQIKVNEGQRQQLEQLLTTYRLPPTEPLVLPKVTISEPQS